MAKKKKKAKNSKQPSGIFKILNSFGPFNIAAVSLGLAFIGQYFLYTRRMLGMGLLFYAIAVIIFLLANKVSKDKKDPLSGPPADETNQAAVKGKKKSFDWKKVEYAVFVLIVLLAIFYRVYMITETPTGCYRDEGQNGNEAINIMNGVEMDGTKLPVYIERWTQNAAMFMYFIAAMFKMFGIGVLQERFVSVLLGSLSVAAIFFLLRFLTGWRMALAGTFILAVMRWHVNFSRIGFLGIFTVLLFIAALYFAYRAYRHRKLSDFIMLGAVTAWSLYSYIAARLIPVGLVVFFLYLIVKEKGFLKKNLKKMAAAVLAFMIVIAPLGTYIAKNFGAFMSRTSTVSIFNDGMLKAIGGPYVEKDGSVKHWSKMYAHNLKNTLLMFNYIGDGNPRHNYNTTPMLDFATGIFFVLGFAYILARIFNPHYFLYVTMFLVMLQAGLLSIESPQAYRTIGVIPLVVIAVIVVFARLRSMWVEQYGKETGKIFTAALIVLLAFIGYKNYDQYFNGWAKDSGAWAEFSTDEYNMGKYLKELGPDWVGLVLPSWYDSYTFNFATYPNENFEKFDPAEWIPIKSKIQKNYVYILDVSYLPLRSVFEGMYPGGKYTDFRHKYGNRILYFTYEVPYSEVKKYQDRAVKSGLIGRYYRDDHKKNLKLMENHWKGQPVFSRLDPFILFNWTVDPIMGPFSVKWTGNINIKKAGKYEFQTVSNDYSDVYIDGRKIVENPGGGGGITGASGTVNLSAGRHSIMVRYYESVNYSKMQFFWRQPGEESMEVVPSEVLIPE